MTDDKTVTEVMPPVSVTVIGTGDGLVKGAKAGKVSKYRNRKTAVDGIVFASAKEARRYQDLELMQHAGQISELRRQVPFPIYIKGNLICLWLADFSYMQNLRHVVEDCKGFKTEIYRLKKKLVEAEYGIRILET